MTQPTTDRQPLDRPLPVSGSTPVAHRLAQAEGLCRANRVRLTPIRRRVLEALHDAGRPIRAYELANALAPQGRRMAPITVYRALDFLIEQGLAHRLTTLNAYIAGNPAPDGNGATAFLICERCGGVSEVSSPELHESLSKLHRNHAFAPHAKVLELTGRCAHC